MSPRDWTRTLIGPGFGVADWLAMRNQLAPEKYDKRWQQAIEAIEQRFHRRFFDPASAIVALDAGNDGCFPEGRGFALLALDCLLIESLFGYEAGERTGAESTGTQEAFVTVLLTRKPFADWFKEERVASSFARAVRNGVLHDGETREGWLIWKASGTGDLVERLPDGCSVLYRDNFHAAVRAYFANYFSGLRAPTGDLAIESRKQFKRRVDTLCDESDPAYLPARVARRASAKSRAGQ